MRSLLIVLTILALSACGDSSQPPTPKAQKSGTSAAGVAESGAPNPATYPVELVATKEMIDAAEAASRESDRLDKLCKGLPNFAPALEARRPQIEGGGKGCPRPGEVGSDPITWSAN